MKKVEPEVYFVSQSKLNNHNFEDYLNDIGNPNWAPDHTVSDGENLVEAAGRMCYRSWQPYDPDKPDCTNPNVTKVREGNEEYLGNILDVGHGSILEHVNMTFICRNISRVFTHELVRHRAGCAYSQESLRYVRLTDLSFWFPPEVEENRQAKELFEDTVRYLEQVQTKLAAIYDIDNMKNFNKKKQLTSMFRRLAPIGLSTSILFTANIRAMRHMISMRTAPSAEVEMRVVFNKIAEVCKRQYPNFFQDMNRSDTNYEWVFDNPKV